MPPQYLVRPIDERPVSDMASELLERVISGLRLALMLSERDELILFHYLFGRSCAATGVQVGLRETTVHKHLHRVFAKTETNTRRELLHYGLLLDKQRQTWLRPVATARPQRRAA